MRIGRVVSNGVERELTHTILAISYSATYNISEAGIFGGQPPRHFSEGHPGPYSLFKPKP